MLPAYVARPRASQRQRRSPHPVAARRARSPWLRTGQADRPAIRRRPQVPRRVALPHALSPRAPRPHPGTMGREERPTPQALLPSDRRGTEDADLAATELEHVLCGVEQSGAITSRVAGIDGGWNPRKTHARLEDPDPRAGGAARRP